MAMSVLCCFALPEEAAPFRKLAAGRPGVAILVSGIGRRNAATAVRAFLAANAPALVLTCGFAGGLNPALKLGEVVVELGPRADPPTVACYHRLADAGAQPAKFHCTDRIATTATEKRQLRRETGADAVEMESAAIHEVCRERGVGCVTARVISDAADEDLPLDFNALAKPDQSLDYGKLAWTIAKSPGKIGALLTLRRNTHRAAQALAAALARAIFP